MRLRIASEVKAVKKIFWEREEDVALIRYGFIDVGGVENHFQTEIVESWIGRSRSRRSLDEIRSESV